MSRNVRKLIKFVLYHMEIGVLVGVVILIICLFCKNLVGVSFILCMEILMILLKINFSIVDKMNRSVAIFTAGSKVRNIDYLVIGDMVDVADLKEQGKTIVELCAPERTLTASYEILRHTYSIMAENGKLIIACKDKNINKPGYSMYDIWYFHNVTIKRLHLESYKKKLLMPIVFEPICTVRLFLNKRKTFQISECNMKALNSFCDERHIELEYRRII